MSDIPTAEETSTPWRVGRKVGRTLYDCRGELIGVMDTRDLAALVVLAVNDVFGSEDTADEYSRRIDDEPSAPRTPGGRRKGDRDMRPHDGLLDGYDPVPGLVARGIMADPEIDPS